MSTAANVIALVMVVGIASSVIIPEISSGGGSSKASNKVDVVDVLMSCQGTVGGMGYVGLDWGSVTNRHVFPSGDINVVRKFTAKNAYGLDLPKTVYCKYRVNTGLTRATVE